MKKTKILFLLLLIIASSSLKAQEKEHDYIPLLDTGKIWYNSEGMEFGDISITKLGLADTNTYNGKEYINIIALPYWKSIQTQIREDVENKRIYEYGGATDILLYDFSLEEGDSILMSNVWFYVDSVKNIEINSVERKAIYLNSQFNDWWLKPVWVEGIGSLAGLLLPNKTPFLGVWELGELNCCYLNDELIYQSQNAELYGCSLENIAPELIFVDADKDTTTFEEGILIYVSAYSVISNIQNISVILMSPNMNEYVYTGFHYVEENLYSKIIYNFFNETGDWYLTKLEIEDANENVKEVVYDYENTPVKFYVKNSTDVLEADMNDFTINFNTQTNLLHIKQKSSLMSFFNLYDYSGKLIISEVINAPEKQIELNGLPTGVYICRIYNNKNFHTNKIIKK